MSSSKAPGPNHNKPIYDLKRRSPLIRYKTPYDPDKVEQCYNPLELYGIARRIAYWLTPTYRKRLEAKAWSRDDWAHEIWIKASETRNGKPRKYPCPKWKCERDCYNRAMNSLYVKETEAPLSDTQFYKGIPEAQREDILPDKLPTARDGKGKKKQYIQSVVSLSEPRFHDEEGEAVTWEESLSDKNLAAGWPGPRSMNPEEQAIKSEQEEQAAGIMTDFRKECMWNRIKMLSSGMSQQKVAEAEGVKQQAIQKTLQRFNTFVESIPQRIKKCTALREQGKSVEEIARITGWQVETVEVFLRRKPDRKRPQR